MKRFDAIIIGSSFASVGYALERGNTLIAEKTEMLDTEFYLPMVNFHKSEYTPITELGKDLFSIFDERALFGEDSQNVNAFEIALARFAEKNPSDIYLKCRVIEKTPEDGGYIVSLLHNGGIERVFAKEIIDARPETCGERRLTVLFESTDDAAVSEVASAFQRAEISEAHYSGRYAAYIPTVAEDINDAKVEIYGKWQSVASAKIIYIAPVFHYTEAYYPLSGGVKNPIESFERGILLAKEAKK